jgi:hypothetical protein
VPKPAVSVNATAITLNSAWLRNRVAELGLKQWWLAEQISVDKKTGIRWLHGHVRAIRPANAAALAGVLGTRANLLHWRGECAQAQAHWRQGLALARFLEPTVVAGLHNNLGMQLYETGEFEAGERELLSARGDRAIRAAGRPAHGRDRAGDGDRHATACPSPARRAAANVVPAEEE